MRIRKLLIAAVLVLASFTTAFTAATFVHAAPASASVGASTSASSHTRLWWDGKTARAFTAYESRPSAERFRHMVQDSRHADTYLRVDVALWARDVKRHAGRRTLELDRSYVAMDVTLTGDQG